MKRIISTLTLVAAMAGSYQADAQAQGYLGKMNVATYSFDMGFDFFSPGLLAPKHSLNYQRVMGRNWTLKGSIGYQTNSMDNFDYLNSGNTEYRYTGAPEEYPGMSVLDIGIAIRSYSKVVAPTGGYWEYGFSYATGSTTFPLENYESNGGASLADNNETEFSVSAFRFNLGVGATRVIQHQVVIDYGARAGINILPYSYDGDYFMPYNNRIEDELFSRVNGGGYFLLHLAVGYIF